MFICIVWLFCKDAYLENTDVSFFKKKETVVFFNREDKNFYEFQTTFYAMITLLFYFFNL